MKLRSDSMVVPRRDAKGERLLEVGQNQGLEKYDAAAR